jgi:hypothetical protein
MAAVKISCCERLYSALDKTKTGLSLVEVRSLKGNGISTNISLFIHRSIPHHQ